MTRLPGGAIAGVPQIHVAHLTSVHAPTDVRIFVKECRSLAAAGYEVTLVAPGDISQDLDGVHTVAVRPLRGRLARATRTAWAVYRAGIASNAQVCHIHDPELIWIGFLLKMRGRKVIYDAHEDLPRQISTKDWIRPVIRRPLASLAGAVERAASLVFDGIVAVTPLIASRFPVRKTTVVRNYPILDEFSAETTRIPYASRPSLIAYVGGVEEPRGALAMVSAMALVDPRYEAQLIMAGRLDPPELAGQLTRLPGWDRCSTPGWLNRGEVADLLATARIGIATLKPTPNYVNSYPTKIFEYMAAGLPVIASNLRAWRPFVTDSESGLAVDPDDPTAIARAIEALLRDPVVAQAMGERGRAAVMSRFSWATERDALLHLYGGLVGQPMPPPSR